MELKMIRIIIFISIFIFYSNCFSQNLIPNPSLEDENTCHTYQEQCAPKAWRSNSLKAFLYYDYKISKQDETILKPAHGSRCIALRLFNTHRKLDRSFIQTPFLCQLEKGKKYKLTFQILSKTYYLNSFEILFVDTIVISKKNDPLFEKKPQVKFEFTKPFTPNKWMELETIYTANGNEIGMMIGNFKTDDATNITRLKKKKRKDIEVRRVYHYFDNFSLTPIDSLENKCDLEKNKQYIYADSARHIIQLPPNSIQNIPLIDTVKIEAPTLKKEPLSTLPKPIIKEKFTPRKIFTLPNILFETNSDRLLPISYNSLDELIVYLKKNQNFNLKIIGHTDHKGPHLHNLTLSEKRSKSVANYLTANGIHISRITTQGKGETNPIASNDTPEGRKQNRRVEFEIKE